MKRLFFLAAYACALASQSALACTTKVVRLADIPRMQRDAQRFEREQRRIRKRAVIVVIGVLGEITPDPLEGSELSTSHGVIKVEKVERGKSSTTLEAHFINVDLSTVCSDIFVPSEGRRSRFYINNGYIVAEDILDGTAR